MELLLDILQAMGFCIKFCDLIHRFLSLITYSVLLNRSHFSIFQYKQDLRKGDVDTLSVYDRCWMSFKINS